MTWVCIAPNKAAPATRKWFVFHSTQLDASGDNHWWVLLVFSTTKNIYCDYRCFPSASASWCIYVGSLVGLTQTEKQNVTMCSATISRIQSTCGFLPSHQPKGPHLCPAVFKTQLCTCSLQECCLPQVPRVLAFVSRLSSWVFFVEGGETLLALSQFLFNLVSVCSRHGSPLADLPSVELFLLLVIEDRLTVLWTCLNKIYFHFQPAYCPSWQTNIVQ